MYVDTVYGFSIDVFEKDYVSNTIRRYGLWEPVVSHVIQTIIKENGGIVVDIGSYIGYYSLMASKAGAQKVIAVEPIDLHVEKLRNSLQINSVTNVQIHKNVVSSVDDHSFSLTVNESNRGGTRIDLTSTQNTVTSVTLKKILEGIQKVTLMKIDAEGHEYEILNELSSVISKTPINHIVIEISPIICGSKKCIDVVTILEQNGYKLHDLGCHQQGEKLVDFKLIPKSTDYFINKILTTAQFDLLASK